MNTEEPQKTWEEYYRRKKAQRVQEAGVLSKQMAAAGVDESTVLALDFVHFSQSEENANFLAEQLKENYEMSISVASDNESWQISGTTRPYGINLNSEQHMGWVEFMCDVAQSHGCVFSTWELEAGKLGQKLSLIHI